MKNMIRYLSMLVALVCSVTAWGQNTDDFNPTSPTEPGTPVLPVHPVEPVDTTTYYVLTLQAQEGGSVKSGGGKYGVGTTVEVVANAAFTNFVFTGWTDESGDTISTALSFQYTMPARNAALLAHYEFNPGSPSEPAKPDIEDTPKDTVPVVVYYKLALVAEEGGSISAGAGEYVAGTEVTVTASAPAANFVFTGWTNSKGDAVSSDRSFTYTMPESDETLTAHYSFEPGSPAEPSKPDIKEPEPKPEPIPTHELKLTVEEGGSVTVNGTAVNGSYTITLEEGAEAAIATSLSTNFVFDGWYKGGELYSDQRSFTFTMDSVDVALVAKFNFEPGAPAEPSMPQTTNNELYLMSVVGLPGETINYPLYLNSNDTLRDIRFEMQFPHKMVPDFSKVVLSPNAVGYTFSYERIDLANVLGVKARKVNEGIIDPDNQLPTYAISLTGGITPPGNTALFVVPVTIEPDVETERHRVWLSQVEVMRNDSTVVTATTRNGAINTDYVEPDSYAYLDNLISVGSTAYSTTQAQQISRLEPFTVDVPADSIAYILGCSDVSFVTFKGRASLQKITDDETAENGFWFGKDGYVRSYVADADSMRMAVQYNPDTHIMSIMQYPGAYEVGDADTVKVYFTYKYKYYEVELRLNIDRADRYMELGNDLHEMKDSLQEVKTRIAQAYEATDAKDMNALSTQCDSLISVADGFLPLFKDLTTDNSGLTDDIYNNVSKFVEESNGFIAQADSLMPLYVKAFADLQAAKVSLVATMTELAETATPSSLASGKALVDKVEAEYTGYDVAKAETMTDSLSFVNIVIRNSVGYDNAVAELSSISSSLNAEKEKIASSFEKTGANDVKSLDVECDALIADNVKLSERVNEIIASEAQLPEELIESIASHKSDVDTFIAHADSLMSNYEAAFAGLQTAKASLIATMTELAETATASSLERGKALVDKVEAEYVGYDVATAVSMTDSLNYTNTVIRYSVGYDNAVADLSSLSTSLNSEKEKIVESYVKTNADDISALGKECEELISVNAKLTEDVESVISADAALSEELIASIASHKADADAFIAHADSLMPQYEKAFADMQTAKTSLIATMTELAETATASSLERGKTLVDKVEAEYTGYDVAKAVTMTDSLNAADVVVRNSVGYDNAVSDLSALSTSLNSEKEKIVESYVKTNADDISALGKECEELISVNAKLTEEVESVISAEAALSEELMASIASHKQAADAFVAHADSLMPQYEKAFADLQTAKTSLIATMTELAETATASSLERGKALVDKVEAEYVGYDVEKAVSMTDSLSHVNTVIRNSVGYDNAVAELSSIVASLNAEKEKIAASFAKTNANNINALNNECDALIADNAKLVERVEEVIASEAQLPEELTANIASHKADVEAFIAHADSLMSDCEEALASLNDELNALRQQMKDLEGVVMKSVMEDAEKLCADIEANQPNYSLSDYADASDRINEMKELLNASVQTENVDITVPDPGHIENFVPAPEMVEYLKIVGPVNGTDIKFIRDNMRHLKSLDISEAWILEGGEAYLDSIHTQNLTIGERMFSDMENVENIVLCDSVVKICDSFISNTPNISVITIPEMTKIVDNGALNGTRPDIKVVWNSKDATVPAMLNGNPSLIVYAVDGVKGEKDWQNILHNGHIDNITLRDDCDMYIPEAFHAGKVIYSRKFTKETHAGKASGWESIVLPFDVQTVTHRSTGRVLAAVGSAANADARFWLAELGENGFHATTSIRANVPAIVRMPNSAEFSDEDNVVGVVVFSAENTMLNATADAAASVGKDYELAPTYSLVEQTQEFYVLNDEEYEGYMPGGVFVKGVDKVKPFEAYIVATSFDASQRRFIPVFSNDESVGISEREHGSSADDSSAGIMYNLAGQRINAANAKGIVIVNGKKVIK